MKVGSYTGTTSYTINDNVCPQMLIIRKTNGNFPSRVVVKLAGRGMLKDLDLAAMKRETELVRRFQSPVPIGLLAINIADGYVPDQRFTIEVTTGAAADAFDLHYWNQNKAMVGFLVTEQMKAFAKQPLRLENFAYLVVEGSDDNDIYNIVFANGVSHPSTKIELALELTEQTTSDAPTTDLAIDNFEMEYKQIELIANADRQVFRLYWLGL